MTHYIAHQQAIIKDNLCTAVLAFSEHDQALMNETFAKFDYDQIVNLCDIQKDAVIGSSWNGVDFNIKYYDSWSLGEDLKWHAPTPKPDGEFFWDEKTLSWVEPKQILDPTV